MTKSQIRIGQIFRNRETRAEREVIHVATEGAGNAVAWRDVATGAPGGGEADAFLAEHELVSGGKRAALYPAVDPQAPTILTPSEHLECPEDAASCDCSYHENLARAEASKREPAGPPYSHRVTRALRGERDTPDEQRGNHEPSNVELIEAVRDGLHPVSAPDEQKTGLFALYELEKRLGDHETSCCAKLELIYANLGFSGPTPPISEVLREILRLRSKA